MAAPKGNQFWKLRSVHGRDKIFSTPEIMLRACYTYFEHQSKKKWNRIDFKGKDSKRVNIPTNAPFTLTGLCIFLHVNTVYFTRFEESLRGKEDQESKDFSQVITHVREVIYTQKFEGAAVGAYNANIIARDLGLIEKTENKNTNTNKISFDPSSLSDAEKDQLFEISLKLKNSDK